MMKRIPILDNEKITTVFGQQTNPFFTDYFAFYSSWFGGITTDPRLMLLPMDDHMVHRGDGVFEALKSINRGLYLFEEHIERLHQSAEAIQLDNPFSMEEIKSVVLQTLQVANRDDVSVRIFLSRGPGNFSVSPYDSVGTQLYVVVLALKPPAEEKYEHGVTICQSTIPVKSSWLATVKSCNYLPNVMMKKEALDRGFDFSINVDDAGFVAEGATENVMIVNHEGKLIHPNFESILRGTMMLRACELANKVGLKAEARAISLQDLISAREVMMCGTTINILPVSHFEKKIIQDGKPGEVSRQLKQLLDEDMRVGERRVIY